MASDLKPCPFCGGYAKAELFHYPNGDKSYRPVCWHEDGCYLDSYIQTADYATAKELAEAWNRRAGDE